MMIHQFQVADCGADLDTTLTSQHASCTVSHAQCLPAALNNRATDLGTHQVSTACSTGAST